jgi:hypothetical protein
MGCLLAGCFLVLLALVLWVLQWGDDDSDYG